MTFAISHELRRVGFDCGEVKQALLDWNDRSRAPLTPGEADRQLCTYAEWVFDRETKLGCKALRDYCLNDAACSYRVAPKPAALGYTIGEAQTFLTREYARLGQGYAAGLVLEALHTFYAERGHSVLFLGLRAIQARVLQTYTNRLDLMTITRAVHRLVDSKLVVVLREGEHGTFGFRKSNGYQLLPWRPP